MNLDKIIRELDLKLLTDPQDYSQIVPSGGYASDLLSCVMAGAPHQGIWITLQSHANIVAVAALLELSAVIITEGAMPEPAVIEKANREHVTLLSTSATTYTIVGKLWAAGLAAK